MSGLSFAQPGEEVDKLVVTQPRESVDFIQHEMTPPPAPQWAGLIDQGSLDDSLSGLRTVDGIRVDVVAREPVLVDPVGMTFDLHGNLFVLEWRQATEQVDTTYDVHYQDGTVATVNRKTKNARDHLKRLIDADGDGVYESSKLIMDDLEYPSTVLVDRDWMYFPSVGHVIRRRAHENGNGFHTEEILRGMCGYHHHQVSGLTLGPDRWMYTTTGDDDNRAEGSDGSRATVLRTGAIFRSRPDGSELDEFARGFRNPYRSVVFDELFNMFHVDNDQEDGSKFQGVRLMHLLEGADYGWRLEMGAKCCRTDFDRGAVFGERPGKMPSMLKVGRGAPAGLLIYQQDKFPDAFRGLLIYPDVYRRNVRAYRIKRNGSSFEVTESFVLMESDDDSFRPVQALAGPDGAIYVLDWHTDSGGAGKSWGDNQRGRLYRLSWAGSEMNPAIQLGDRNAWRQLANDTESQLFAKMKSPDFELRCRAQQSLIERGTVPTSRWLQLIDDAQLPSPTRALAIGAACQSYDRDVRQTLVRLLSDEDFELRRLAAESIGRHAQSTFASEVVSPLLKSAANDAHVAVRRAAALAVGHVMQEGRQGLSESSRSSAASAAGDLFGVLLKWRRESPQLASDVWLFDGFVRALERIGEPAVSRIVSETLNGDADVKELGVAVLESMRTRPAARGLDQLIAAKQGDGLSEQQLIRMIETYRHILVEPPIEATAVAEWLASDASAPDVASPILRVAALRTLAMTGGTSASVVTTATELLDDPEAEVREAAIRSIGQARMLSVTGRLVQALQESSRSTAEKQSIVESLGMMRAEEWPYVDRGQPGVERVIPDLVAALKLEAVEPVASDVLALVGQIDPAAARQPAIERLDATDSQTVAAAVDVLAADVEMALAIGKRYLENRLPRGVKANVAAALQRHSGGARRQDVKDLADQISADGLQLSLAPAEIERVEQLVKSTGDPLRGKQLFLDVERTQCANCHRLEGTGGAIGPDLTRIWQTHSVAKVLESIVEPSREIKEGFASWTAQTREGQVFSGLKISDERNEIVLRDANGRDVRLRRDEVETLQPTNVSLMPVGTVSQLAFGELIDLLAFLRDDVAQRSLRTGEDNTP